MSQRDVTDLEHDLEAAVFRSLYYSKMQRLLRLTGISLITCKHGFRGLLFVWPLTILFFVDFPGAWEWIKLVFIALALGAWIRFIFGSVREDFDRFIKNKLLKFSELRRVI